MTPPEPARQRRTRLGLSSLLGGMAVLHVIVPRAFEAMIPDYIPGDPKRVNQLATLAEGGSSLLLASRKTAAAGGVAAAGTFLVVWIANIQAAIDGGYPVPKGLPARDLLGSKHVAWGRVPLQIPLIWWALTVSRNARTAQQDSA